MYTVAQIRDNSRQLCLLHARIAETYRFRDRGPEQWAQWENACEEFNNRFDQLSYPEGAAGLVKVKAGDAGAIDSAILFLEADPYHFRSGYVKEYLWRALARCALSAKERERVLDIAFARLNQQIRREYWYMCRAMAIMGTPDFWTKVTQTTESDDVAKSKRPSYLLAFRNGIEVGAKVQKQVFRDVLRNKYASR